MSDPTTASRAVLIEVANVLGVFRNELVLVGGWVPDLWCPDRGHIGSLDVDLAVSPQAIADNAYETILKRMTNAGYALQTGPTRFVKAIAGAENPVKVDLVSGQSQQPEKSDSIQVNELRINALRGIDLAFVACDELEISGAMPDGVHNVVRLRIVRPEAFILTKAFSLDERSKEKDAYDIVFVLQNYPAGLEELATRMQGILEHGLARDGIEILQKKFASLDAAGPVWAARIDQQNGTDYEQSRRAAFEYAKRLFRLLKIDR